MSRRPVCWEGPIDEDIVEAMEDIPYVAFAGEGSKPLREPGRFRVDSIERRRMRRRELAAEHGREIYRRLREMGWCVYSGCKSPSRSGKSLCAEHAKAKAASNRARYHAKKKPPTTDPP